MAGRQPPTILWRCHSRARLQLENGLIFATRCITLTHSDDGSKFPFIFLSKVSPFFKGWCTLPSLTPSGTTSRYPETSQPLDLSICLAV